MGREFQKRLAGLRTAGEAGSDRSWVYVPYDQLHAELGPLARREPEELGVVLIESAWKAGQRPYHKQKLALVLTNMRHFALELAERGVDVRYVMTRRPYAEVLAELAEELGPLEVMEPAEREQRLHLAPLFEAGALERVPHDGWLTTRELFERSERKAPPYRMDRFYRAVRQDTGLLMEDGKPVGGKYSFDAENREPWKGEPPAPEPPTFEVDETTEEVVALVERDFAQHPGEVRADELPATRADAERLLAWAREHCLPHFGPYEDAMSTRSTGLFHTRLSPLINLHRLLPREALDAVVDADVPLASKEGFVRQLIGWREFMRHVHDVTDGFRDLPDGAADELERPGDGGFERWSGDAWEPAEPALPGGARPSVLDARAPLPPAYWGAESGLACLDRVTAEVWEHGYTHHIPRLMVLANIATLLGVDPRELTDWFWVAFIDAYDWVVEPNVLGMGTFGAGEVLSTKPYVSGAAYVRKMSDYCPDCAFDPRGDCPLTSLYWSFLARSAEALEDNPRMRLPLSSLRKRDEAQRERDAAVHRWCLDTLAEGGVLAPEDAP